VCPSVPDSFYVLQASTTSAHPKDFATAAFAVISSRNDAIGANSTRGILSPIAVPFQAEVRSWVHDPNSCKHRLISVVYTHHAHRHLAPAPEEEQKHAFLENGTFTLYVWPIGCSLYIDNITAEVGGNNKLLSSTSKPRDIDRTHVFNRERPTDPLLISWEPLIESIWYSEMGTAISSGAGIPVQWLENILYAPLNSGVPSTTGPSPTVAERMAAMEKILEHLTGLAYGMLVQSFRSQTRDGSTVVGLNWEPTSAIITGQRVVLCGKFVVNGLQTVVGTISICVLAFALLFAITQRCDNAPDSHGGVIRDGGVIDLISLVNRSALPGVIASANVAASTKDERRAVAERTMVV
jgi:hypothetical protein